jgi:hypothetical protein
LKILRVVLKSSSTGGLSWTLLQMSSKRTLSHYITPESERRHVRKCQWYHILILNGFMGPIWNPERSGRSGCRPLGTIPRLRNSKRFFFFTTPSAGPRHAHMSTRHIMANTLDHPTTCFPFLLSTSRWTQSKDVPLGAFSPTPDCHFLDRQRPRRHLSSCCQVH